MEAPPNSQCNFAMTKHRILFSRSEKILKKKVENSAKNDEIGLKGSVRQSRLHSKSQQIITGRRQILKGYRYQVQQEVGKFE